LSRATVRPTGVVLLICAALLPAGSSVAAASGPVRPLSLDQALAMAARANRTLMAERARLAQAQTSIAQAWAALFPTITAQGRYTRNNMEFKFPVTAGGAGATPQIITIQPYNQLDGVVSFTAPLLAPAAYPALRSVKDGVRSAEADFEASQTTVLFAVAQAYFTEAIADEVLAARRSSVGVARATVDNAQARFSTGGVTKVDVDRAQLALVRAEQSVREALFGKQRAHRALATLIQLDADFRVEPGPIERADDSADTHDLAAALRLRPELRAIELLARASAGRERAYAWRWAPTLSGFGSARVFNYDNFAREHHAWAIGAQLEWVLYDGGTRDAQRHLAAAQAREAQARSEALRDAIRDDLADASGLLETKRHARAAADQSVNLAMQTLDMVRTQYESGTVAQIDLLQAQDNLTAAREALAQVHFELAVADLVLRRAAGTFPGAALASVR
jgi:outer membrane protein